VRETGARHLVIAAPPAGLLDRWRPGLAERLASQLPDVHLHITAGQARSSGAAPDGGACPDRAPRVTGRQAHATVRVYLGYAPGCGITSAMLEEAGRRRSRGADVVVATVDSRGREGVSAALESLEVIGDGTSLDTGAVLARHPEVVCIDDLSAADPSGESRFAAARQLADAGITVVATVHLGSLLDGDGAAGDTLDETAVLALADEIELVDAPPSALADRVKRGEIVPAGGAGHALQTDYSLETLGAQREQAFTIVTEHAERRLAAYRGSGAAADSDVRPRVLGCAAPWPGMEPLIRRSAALAAQLAGDFLVAVFTPVPAAPGRWHPARVHRDGRGFIRVITAEPSHERLVQRAFEKIRQASLGMPAVMIRQLEALAKIMAETSSAGQRRVLLDQAAMIQRASERSVPEAADRDDVRRRYEAVLAAAPAG
jgi:Osmosensitive K+ channel His kinase sensor domain/Predicted membrane protein (DUF2254)